MGYDSPGVPVLPYGHPLSKVYLLSCHGTSHCGVNATVLRSRARVWILSGVQLTRTIVKNCVTCRYLKGIACSQRMAQMPEFRRQPAPVFHSVAVDLFGPLQYRDMVKKRVTGKGWCLCACTPLPYIWS